MSYTIAPLIRKESNGEIDSTKIVPLTIYIRHQSKQKQIATHIKERSRDFTNRRNKFYVDSRVSNSIMKNKEIDRIRLDLEEIEVKGGIQSIEDYKLKVLKVLNKTSKSDKNIEVLTSSELIENYLNNYKETTRKTLSYRLGLFVDHLARLNINTVEDITVSTMKSFRAFLIEKRLRNHTSKAIIDKVKSFLRWCIEANRKIANNVLSFKDKLETGKGLNVSLENSELTILEKAELIGKMDRVRDLALFQFYTGQRFGDIASFKKDNVVDGKWAFFQQKTGAMLELGLHEKALRILEKYKSYKSGLPIISSQNFNKSLKTLMRKIGLTRKVSEAFLIGDERHVVWHQLCDVISSHHMRHSFISSSFGNGSPMNHIMNWSGHTTLKSFEKYVHSTPKESAESIAKSMNNI